MNKRRHELEENELASFLGKKIGAARENPDDLKRWAVPILLAIIAICGVWIGVYLVQTVSQPTPGSWLPVMIAVTSQESPEATRERLETIAETPDEPAALWAKQMRADSFLQEGSAQLFAATEAERKEGLELLKSAQEEFATVRAQAEDQGKDALLIRRATFGEAQAFEALAQPDKAVKIYAELAENAADSAVGEASKKKLSFLAHKNSKGEWVVREDVASFLKEYQAFVPKPPAIPAGTGIPPVDPAADVLRTAPAPDLSFPGMEEFILPAGGSGTDAPEGGDFAPGESPLTPAPGESPLTPAPGDGATTPASSTPETPATPEGTTPAAPTGEAESPAPEAPAESAPETTTPESTESAAP